LILVGRVDARCKALLNRWQGLPGVKMMGHVPDPVSLYQQADVFAFPTIEEGSALVIYEALACGLPVITTPNAGSVVRDEIEGFLLPMRDVDGMAGRLERLRADAQLRHDMGNAARRRAEGFTWRAYGDNLAQLYQQLVLDSTTFHGPHGI
jgi:glycosyltransferase involved in cell wall biosynthesis